MTPTDLAVLIALCAALASAIGDVIRQRSAQEVTDKEVGHLKLFWLSVHDLRWWDYAAWFVYLTHFVVTLFVAAILWTWWHHHFAPTRGLGNCALVAVGFRPFAPFLWRRQEISL